MPTFVLEYLLGMYCSTDDDADSIEEGVGPHPQDPHRELRAPRRERDDQAQDRASWASYTIIDKVDARLDEYDDIYVASFTNFNIGELRHAPRSTCATTPKMLTGGIWCHHASSST